MPLTARLAAVLGATCALPGAALRSLGDHVGDQVGDQGPGSQNLQQYSFRSFVRQFGRTYKEGTEQWTMRENLFEKTREQVMKFNMRQTRSWTMGVTPFMDYTAEERGRLLGLKGRRAEGMVYAPAQAASLDRGADLPSEFSVEKPGAKLFSVLRDQGECGSCWAQAATSTLEGHVEANETLMAQLLTMSKKGRGVPEVPTLSTQTVVSCTPNQRHCGGQGGCDGATVELAYSMIVARGGLPFASEWPYESGSGSTPKCKGTLFKHAQIAISGYSTLPMNKLSPLKQALVQTGGPVAVSVDASGWFFYGGGVFSDTEHGTGDFEVNHAVTLMAYKEPDMYHRGYWLIKNSWGPYWGEQGFIRVEMKKDEEAHCGWDYKAHDGVACDGEPDKAWVCGTCGILYDSSFPTGVHLRDV